MTDQATFDDLLGESVLPTLTVWRNLNNRCGWCTRDHGLDIFGCGVWHDPKGAPIYTNICRHCRDKHGLNAHLHAIRDGRYKIGSQP